MEHTSLQWGFEYAIERGIEKQKSGVEKVWFKAQRKKSQKSRKNFEKPLDKRGRMWYTIGAAREQPASRSEAGEKARFRRNRAKKLEKSLKNLLTSKGQSGIINKLRAARWCSEKHSSLKIEQQDSCILMTKVQRLRKFFWILSHRDMTAVEIQQL